MSKVLKSKCLVFGQFWSKSDNSSSSWWATVQILKEKYLHHIFAKNVASIGKKPVAGVSETSNLAHRQITSSWGKNLKITFFTGASIIVKMEFEIYKYFSWFFSQCSPSLSKCNLKYENICILNRSSPNIWAVFYIIVFNSSPKFYSHPACRLLELQLTFCKSSFCRRLCSTRTQI